MTSSRECTIIPVNRDRPEKGKSRDSAVGCDESACARRLECYVVMRAYAPRVFGRRWSNGLLIVQWNKCRSIKCHEPNFQPTLYSCTSHKSMLSSPSSCDVLTLVFMAACSARTDSTADGLRSAGRSPGRSRAPAASDAG